MNDQTDLFGTPTGQLALDVGAGSKPKFDYFLTDEGNEDAYALCDDLDRWTTSRLVLQGPAKSGRSLLAQAAAQSGADIEENADAVLETFEENALMQAEYEQDLFHRLNWAEESNGHFLLTATKPPIFWNLAMPDLRSRLLAAPQVLISPPSDALITKLLAKHFSDRQVMVEAGVISYISARIERSHQAVHDVVSMIDKHALMAKKKVSLPLVRKVISGI